MRLYQIQIGTGANHYVHLYSINAGFPLAAPRAWEALGSRKVVFFVDLNRALRTGFVGSQELLKWQRDDPRRPFLGLTNCTKLPGTVKKQKYCASFPD